MFKIILKFTAIIFLFQLTGSIIAAPFISSLTQSPNGDVVIGSSAQYTLTIQLQNNDLPLNSTITVENLAFSTDMTNELSFLNIVQPAGTDCTFNSNQFACNSLPDPANPVTPVFVSFVFDWTPPLVFNHWPEFSFTPGSDTTQTASIVTNVVGQPGQLQFSNTTYSGDEGTDVVIQVDRVGGSTGALTGFIDLGDFGTGTDTASVADYTYPLSSSVTWADGDSSPKFITIPLSQDNLTEGPETLSILLSATLGSTLGTPSQATVTINDTDIGAGVLQFSRSTYFSQEGSSVQIQVDRVGGSEGILTGFIDLGDLGAATDTASITDYNYPLSSSVTWADGDSSPKFINIPLSLDSTLEGRETLSIHLSTTLSSSLGSPTLATITISELGTIQFDSSSYTALEGEDAIINVSRSGGAEGRYAVRVEFGLSGDSATSEDYQLPAVVELIFDDDELSTKTVNIPLLSDALIEGTETLTLRLVSTDLNDPSPLGVPAETVLSIVDTTDIQGGVIEFSGTSHSSSEGGIAVITVSREGSSEGAVTATIVLGSSTDTATVDDYDFEQSVVLSWQDGDATPITLMLPTIADQLNEGTESLTLTITEVQGGNIGSVSENTVLIHDQSIGATYTSIEQTPDTFITPGTTVTYTVEMRIPAGSGFNRSIPVTNNGVDSVSEFSYGNNPAGIDVPCTQNTANGTFDCAYTNSSGATTQVFLTFSWEPTVVGLNRIILDFGGSSGTQYIFDTYVTEQPLAQIEGLNQFEQSTAQALDNGCSTLSGMALLSLAQQDLLDTCLELDAAVNASTELQRLIPEEVASQARAAFTASNLQVRNVNARLTSLRNGISGIDLSGINLSIDGEVIPGSVLNLALNNTKSSPTADLGLKRWGAFVNANVSFGEQGSNSFSDGFEFNARGITAGIDYRESSDLVFGAALGYDTNETTYSGESAGMEMDSLHLSLYGSAYKKSNIYIDGLMKLGWNHYDTTRDVTSGNNPQQLLSGTTRSIENSLSLGAGYDKSFKALSVGAYGRFDYTAVNINGYTESPSDPLAPGSGSALHVNKQTLTSMTATAGTELSYSISTKRGVYVPNLRLEWEHLVSDNRSDIEAQFIHDPTSTSFGVAVDENPDTDYLNIGTGFSVVTPRGKSGFLYIEKRLLQENTEQTWIKGGVRIEF